MEWERAGPGLVAQRVVQSSRIGAPGAGGRNMVDTEPVRSVHETMDVPRASWMPMVVIAAAQIMLVFNVSTLQVSIDAIAASFNAPATTVGTAIVTYALVVAGFIMLGTPREPPLERERPDLEPLVSRWS